jgi:hypothetical protein
MTYNGNKTRIVPPEPTGKGNRQPDNTAGGSSNHDARGRFAKGNKAGTGNPYARRVAMLRRAMLRVVKPDDLQAIIVKLILLACTGDVAAARLVLQYTLGKPTESVDPDTLDLQELELAKQRLAFRPELDEILNGVPPMVACEMARIMVPGFEDEYRRGYIQMAREREAEEQAAQGDQEPDKPEPCVPPPQATRRDSEEPGSSQPPRLVGKEEQLELLLGLLRQLNPEGLAESVKKVEAARGTTTNGRRAFRAESARERQMEQRSGKTTVNKRSYRNDPDEEDELFDDWDDGDDDSGG